MSCTREIKTGGVAKEHRLFSLYGLVYYMPFVRFELILVKTLPMIGPRISNTAITTTATKTRINAYSTRPWPFSFGANNIAVSPPFLVRFL
jgi:hypothetical protein